MWLLLSSLATAGPALASFVDEQGTSVHQAGVCSSLAAWTAAFEDADPIGAEMGGPEQFLGVAHTGPIFYAVVGPDGDRVLSIPLSDSDAFEAFLPRLYPAAIRSGDVFRLQDGRAARVDLAEDRAVIRLSGRARGALPASHDPMLSQLAGLLDASDCSFVVGTGRPVPAGVEFAGGSDRVRVVMPPPLELDVELATTGPAQLRTSDRPQIAARANLDLDALLQSDAARTTGLGEVLGGAIDGSRIEVAPGVEVAIWLPRDIVILAPVSGFRTAQRVLRRAARSEQAVGVEDGLIVLAFDDLRLWVTRLGPDLVVATNPQLALAALDDRNPLALETNPWAESPGLVGSVAVPQEMIRALGFDGLPSVFDVHMTLGPGVLFADVRSQDLAQQVLDEVWPEVPGDPVGSPPSTEALSVLMTLSTAEAAHRAEHGVFVGYSGGPRELEALDGEAVPWAGIPELGVGPMATACRYEVELVGEGYSARSICDEDADGRHAITVLGPGGRPNRVTPEEVR